MCLKFCLESPLFQCACGCPLKTGVGLRVFYNIFAQISAPGRGCVSEGTAPDAAKPHLSVGPPGCFMPSSPLPSSLFIFTILFFKDSLHSLLFCLTVRCAAQWRDDRVVYKVPPSPRDVSGPTWPTELHTVTDCAPRPALHPQDAVSISPRSCQFASLLES